MKQTAIIILLSLSIIVCQIDDIIYAQEQPLPQNQIKEQIDNLQNFIIPPKGTTKAEVDEIYGVSTETKKIKKNQKGSKANYPIHTYQLLKSENQNTFQASLNITYRSGKVHNAGINHSCVVKNRAIYMPGSPSELEQEKSIESENHGVLRDLIEIKQKYENKLKNSSWNK